MRVRDVANHVANHGPGRSCSPRQGVALECKRRGSETRVDDVAGNICQALPPPPPPLPLSAPPAKKPPGSSTQNPPATAPLYPGHVT